MTASSVQALFKSFGPPGLGLVDRGEVSQLVGLNNSAASGITALASGTALTSPQLTSFVNEISVSTGANTDSVTLPPAVPGLSVRIFNDTANTIKIWGNGSDTIVDKGGLVAAAASSCTIATALMYEFTCYKAGLWKASSSA